MSFVEDYKEVEQEIEDYNEFYGEDSPDDYIEAVRNPFVEKIYRDLNYNNYNFNGVFIGKSGSGKSWAALRLAEMVDKDFNANKIIFNVKDFMRMIVDKKINRGDIIVFDEAGVGVNARLWYSNVNRIANTTFQTMRNRNFGTLFTVPFTEYVDTQTRKMFHALFQAIKIDRSNRISTFKVSKIQYSVHKNKYYFPKYEFNIKGNPFVLDKIKFRSPSRKLINAYEKKKAEFQEQLYAASLEELEKAEGSAGSKSAKEDRKQKIKEALAIVRNNIDKYIVTRGKTQRVNVELMKQDLGFKTSILKAVKTLIEKELGFI